MVLPWYCGTVLTARLLHGNGGRVHGAVTAGYGYLLGMMGLYLMLQIEDLLLGSWHPEATLALLGTYDTIYLEDSAGTTVFQADALFKSVQRRELHDDMTVLDAQFLVQSLPSVPDLSSLGFA